MLLVAGCGDDEEDEPERTLPTATETDTAPEQGRTETETAPATTSEEPRTSPEEEPGGAGDEEPAHSQALLTARAGRLTPRLIRVPPFIAVRVELRSGDGRAYTLLVGRERLRVGGEVSSASTLVEGLRPGRSLVVRLTEGGARARIEASAEPGP